MNEKNKNSMISLSIGIITGIVIGILVTYVILDNEQKISSLKQRELAVGELTSLRLNTLYTLTSPDSPSKEQTIETTVAELEDGLRGNSEELKKIKTPTQTTTLLISKINAYQNKITEEKNDTKKIGK